MGRKVLHKSHVIYRTHVTITTAQCRRHANTSDGMNIADRDEDVTCKFCLRLMEFPQRVGRGSVPQKGLED
jgi:hypothetical protein